MATVYAAEPSFAVHLRDSSGANADWRLADHPRTCQPKMFIPCVGSAIKQTNLFRAFLINRGKIGPFV